jgi:hypothetical protein
MMSLNMAMTKAVAGADVIHPDRLPGFILNGYSVKEVSEEGQRQRVYNYKRQRKPEAQDWVVACAGYFDRLRGKAPPLPDLAKTAGSPQLLSIVCIADAHLNLLSHDGAYGLKEGIARLKSCASQLLGALPAGREIVIANLGDLFHNDRAGCPQTPQSLHWLETSQSYPEALEAGVEAINQILRAAASKWQIVNWFSVVGNHDKYSAPHGLNMGLKMAYNGQEARIKIHPVSEDWVIFPWAKNLLVLHHGDRCGTFKRQREFISTLPQCRKAEFVLCPHGHKHHSKEEQLSNIKCVQLPATTARDSYSWGHGYGGAEESMVGFMLHPEGYELGRRTVSAPHARSSRPLEESRKLRSGKAKTSLPFINGMYY